MERIKDGPVTFWQHGRGKRPHTDIARMQCIVGDANFVATGGKPKCPACGSKRMRGVMEVEQLGLFSSAFNLVMRCTKKECSALVCYNYEIDYDQSLRTVENGN